MVWSLTGSELGSLDPYSGASVKEHLVSARAAPWEGFYRGGLWKQEVQEVPGAGAPRDLP